MYVCMCNAVTEREIRAAADAGVRRFDELQSRTGCSTCCGCCESQARDVLRQAIRDVRLQLPLSRVA